MLANTLKSGFTGHVRSMRKQKVCEREGRDRRKEREGEEKREEREKMMKREKEWGDGNERLIERKKKMLFSSD